MAHQKHSSAAAQAYARSLLELANEKKAGEAVGQELTVLVQLVRDNPPLRIFLEDPAVGDVDRKALLEKVFRGRLSPLLLSFLGVLNQKHRLALLEGIGDSYEDLLQEQLGKVEVDVTVAQRLSPDQFEQVRQRVSAALKKDAIVHQYVDDSIIGGLILRVQDKLIDASARYQLQALRQKLMEAPVPGQV